MSAAELTELDHLPDGLLERPASALHRQLDGPTLIHLRGKRERPLFVSVLQHGNEVTGWEALRRLLKHHQPPERLPRSLAILIGNVQAARHRLRRLDDQPDFNRCWPGSENVDSDYARLFRRAHHRIRGLRPIAGIDIHNNTGLNPHYAAVNVVRSEHLRLAALFSPKIVYFTKPAGTLAHSFSPYFPAVTLECGQAGEIHGTDHSLAFLETCLDMGPLSERPVYPDAVHLFRMVATVKVNPELQFGFGDVSAPLALRPELDQFNFCELPPGTSFGNLNDPSIQPLQVLDDDGRDVTDQYFSFGRGQLETTREIMPSMLTLDRRVIRQDCLCYFMERIRFEDYREEPGGDTLPESISRSDRPGEPGRRA